jgi:putative nucleotidyltransferase with HDIG domain
MLKKIPTSQLRLGMYVQGLEGRWLDHSFWKSKFLLNDAQDLRRLRDGSVQEVWIDIAQGLDVKVQDERPGLVRQLPQAPEPAASGSSVVSAPAPPPAARSLGDELNQAAAVCKRGRAAVTSMFNEARLGKAVDAERCLPLVDEIATSVFRNPGALVSLARLKTKDDYSYMHSVAVCALMVSLARQLGMDEAASREAGFAGLLHDLGKAVMPTDVLNKPGKLTDAEFDIIRTHPVRGFEMLQEGRGASEAAMDVCLHHHEKMDGRGYPHQLVGEQTSVLARMGAVCDVYDAITSNRPYKSGWDPAESIARMASWKGHLDEGIFKAFVRSLGIYPTGSLVRLKSQRLAVVVEQNPQSLVAPVVKVFYSIKSQMHVPPKRLDLFANNTDAIIGRESAAEWGFTRIDELWADPDALARSKG